MSVAPLGERQLKDLDEPERIYELEIDGVEQPEDATAPPAPPAAPARRASGPVDWKERGQDLARQLTERINEDVMRSLERSLRDLPKPPDQR